MSRSKVCDFASLIYEERTKIKKEFSRDWFGDFVKRHSEEIIKKMSMH